VSGAPLHDEVRFWRDKALPGVEARSSTYTSNAFRTHTHRACLVSLVDNGRTRFTLEGQTRIVQAGQMAVIEAGRRHSCIPVAGSGFSYRVLAVSPGWLAGAAPEAQRPPRFASPGLDDPELFAALAELPRPLCRAAHATDKRLLMACLRNLCPPRRAVRRRRSDCKPRGGAARRHKRSAPNRGALGELARGAGLSPHHFLRVFKAETGLPPHAFQIQQAIEHAKTLLAEGAPISQAALDAGFADQSHFSRLFRAFTGAITGQYLSGGAQGREPASRT
jgi:AraC-like DNA-binding protein